MNQTLTPADARLTWSGHVGLEHSPAGTIARRLTPHSRELFPSTPACNLWNLAGQPAGVRVIFETDSTFVGGHCTPDKTLAPIDIVRDGAVFGSMKIDEIGAFHFAGLTPDLGRIELWLPHHGVFQLHDLEFAAGATIRAAPDARPRWTTYGSSITHAMEAHSPAQTWPARVARNNDLNLTCLGFAGSCHLDPMVARVMRDLPADFISICAGINISGGSLTPRTFRSALIGFISIIREKQPDVPLALISPILSAPRETHIEDSPWSLRAMRSEVRGAVAALNAHGDSATFYVDGLDIIGPNEADIMPDELHPSGDGQSVVAARFEQVVGARLWGAA